MNLRSFVALLIFTICPFSLSHADNLYWKHLLGDEPCWDVEVIDAQTFYCFNTKARIYSLNQAGDAHYIADISPYEYKGFYRDGNTGYLITKNVVFSALYIRLHAFDLTNPRIPREISNVRIWGGGAFDWMNFAKYGDYLYLHGILGAIEVVDISNPYRMEWINKADLSGGGRFSENATLKVIGDYLYFPKQRNIEIYDLSEPTDKQLVKTLDYPEWATDPDLTEGAGTMELKGDWLYVGTHRNLFTIDVSDPLNPEILTTLPGSFLIDIEIIGNTLFGVGIQADTISVVDISTVQPSLINTIQGDFDFRRHLIVAERKMN